jgi:hypothetical protein
MMLELNYIVVPDNIEIGGGGLSQTRRTKSHYHSWKEHLKISKIAKFGLRIGVK